MHDTHSIKVRDQHRNEWKPVNNPECLLQVYEMAVIAACGELIICQCLNTYVKSTRFRTLVRILPYSKRHGPVLQDAHTNIL